MGGRRSLVLRGLAFSYDRVTRVWVVWFGGFCFRHR